MVPGLSDGALAIVIVITVTAVLFGVLVAPVIW